jgi:hypothetical protein
VRARKGLLSLLLLAAACDLQCTCESQNQTSIKVGVEGEPKVEVDGSAQVDVERRVEVEVERTVCDELDFEVVKIVRVAPNPPFHDEPLERVSLRITNRGAEAVKLHSGTDAIFLDDRRTVVGADVHQSEWFMPRLLPAKSAVVVDIVVPEHTGKALRSVEAKAEPEDRPFSECKVVDDLLTTKPGAGKPPAEATPPAEAIDL